MLGEGRRRACCAVLLILSASCGSQPDPAPVLDPPHAALVLIIDVSAQYSVEEIARIDKAIGLAADQLGSDDDFAVLAFDAHPRWVLPFGRPRRERPAPGLLERSEEKIRPDIPSALAEGIQGFRSDPHAETAGRKGCILISTGDSTGGVPETLLEGATKEGITVSTVCTSSKGTFDAVAMSQIASFGLGRFYFTPSPQKVPQLVANESRKFLGK
ncbi:MAG TPA: VWA domain-containing protein [Planctomycetota bacterium]|nr:VWA domain-containing protein [Planctomycetota bacterium]